MTTLPKNEIVDAVRALKRVFHALGAFSFAINLLLLVPAIYMLQMYDRVLTSRNEATLIMLTLIMIVLLLLEATLEFIRSQVLARACAALDVKLSPRIFDATFARALREQGGAAAQALADLANLRQFLTGKALFAFFDAPWTPIYLIVIFLLSPWLGLFSLVAAALLLALAWGNEKTTAPLLAQANRLGTDASQYASNNLRNAEVIEAMGMLPNLRERWFARQARFLAVYGVAGDTASRFGSATRFARLVLQSGILGLGAYLVVDSQLTPGGMIAASILLARALAPVDLAIATWRGVVAARAAYGRLTELLQRYPAVTPTTTPLPRPDGAITVENLVVGAPGSRTPILKGLRFQVEAGTLIAVVGPSASGKSTLARALIGVWGPLSGAVRLDGAAVHTWDREQLGPWVGYLPQDVELFDGTIAENIARFGAIDAERVLQAGQRSGVHDLVVRLPKGYDTPLGEGGLVLSAGQRQRIALARALYGDPALVVLDEPDANLDEAGDQAFLDALRTMKEERRTAFVVTHRANVLALVDRVLVLVDGGVQAFGPPGEVIKRRPRPVAVGDGTPSGETS